MRHRLLAFGWLLCGMGVVMGGLGALTLAGILSIPIKVACRHLDTRPELITWVAAWSAAMVIGVVLLRLARARNKQRSPEPSRVQ
ncbi:MAG: hypothetical protein WC718_03850 [Phycisphaerales bacterium]|jgi:hypothetical protein